jgi:hypothetical protein
MAQADVQSSSRSNVGVWIFRVLLVAAAGFMVFSWYTPWWSADVAIIKGTDDIVLRPWGVDVARQVRVGADPALYSMPSFFGPFVWTYFAVAMLALAASLFLTRKISVGPITLPLATVLIAFVGLSYMAAPAIAYIVGDLRSASLDINFIGKSDYMDPMSHRKLKMVSDLRDGFWYAIYAGGALFVLAVLRRLFVGKS